MFKNMKIWMRFVLSFSLILALLIAIIIVSFNQINVTKDRLSRIQNINNVRIRLTYQMIAAAKQTAIYTKDILLEKYQNQPVENIQKTTINLAEQRRIYKETSSSLEALFPANDKKGIELLVNTKLRSDSSGIGQDKAIELVMAGKPDKAANSMFAYSYPIVIRWIKELQELVKYNEEYNALRYTQSMEAMIAARKEMIILGLMATFLSLMIGLFLTLSITKPLKIATNLVTSRDLTQDISSFMKGGGELGLMIQTFRRDISERLVMEKELITYKDELEEKVKQRTADMSNVLLEVKDTVNILVSTSTQILAATTQVASGTAETATAITETSTTVEEVQQAAKQTAQKAKNVAESAQMVAKVSQNGQKAIEDTVAGMNSIREQMDTIAQTVVRLSEQSQSIGSIIAAVTDIADQSNLLAVNAAIEAAKAGEQGKGFSVVAQEIKNLASQSKQSTLQVRNILNDVQKATSASVLATEQGSKAVEAGVKQSAVAGEAIRVLAESSNEAVQAATQIVASSQQQVVGMDQIGVAMQNINQAGTETAVSMVQSEKAAKNLTELGQKLKEMVDRFKV